MIYTEQNANLAYQRHPATRPEQRGIWKHRQRIPDRYFSDEVLLRPRQRPQPGEALLATELLRQQRLRHVLRSEKLYRAPFAELTEFTHYGTSFLYDFTSGKIQLTCAERIRLSAEVNKLRAAIHNATQLPESRARQQALLTIAKDPRIVKTVVFGRRLGCRLVPSAPPATVEMMSAEDWRLIEDQLVLLHLETSL